jgi:hypothetical protein
MSGSAKAPVQLCSGKRGHPIIHNSYAERLSLKLIATGLLTVPGSIHGGEKFLAELSQVPRSIVHCDMSTGQRFGGYIVELLMQSKRLG